MKSQTHLEFMSVSEALDGADALLFIGRQSRLLADDVVALLPADLKATWTPMIEGTSPGDKGARRETWRAEAPKHVVAAVLPDLCSRYNAPGRPDAVARLAKDLPEGSTVAVILAVDEGAEGFSAGLALARALPQFSRKSRAANARYVQAAICPGSGAAPSLRRVQVAADAVRRAAALVDAPTSELDTDAFTEIARNAAAEVGAEITVLQGLEVARAGLGGLWGVGKAASRGPAMVVLEHRGEGQGTVAFIGKGIVYDTGGLSIKGKAHMPGMKADMGGAAAVLGAFLAAAELGAAQRIYAVLCLAENAVGPESVRPDDILTMYSGKTVEVNNTDAEGRLVLADGIAWATRHLRPDVVIDVATLTGAQLVSTGRLHAAGMSDDEALEQAAVAAGRRAGELVHPMPYCPEFFRGEFKSEVADLKNSVKDRMNGQVSCAGQFIGEHLDSDWTGRWLHLDIAGPATSGERGTGFGVGLLLTLLDTL